MDTATFPLFETQERMIGSSRFLGMDDGLTECSARAMWLTLLRPIAWLAAYTFAVCRGWWLPALATFPFLFVAQVVALNDLMHGSLGLGARTTEALVMVFGLLVFESGHAIRVSHLAHHDMGGGSDDPESYVDLLSTRALARQVPIYRFRVWAWALRHGRGQRRWMILEMTLCAVAYLVALTAGRQSAAAFAVYVALSVAACWTFPIVSARGPQADWGRNRRSHAVIVRGTLLPRMLHNLTFHVEHHLFPAVPSYRLPELAARLDDAFNEVGAHRIVVP